MSFPEGSTCGYFHWETTSRQHQSSGSQHHSGEGTQAANPGCGLLIQFFRNMFVFSLSLFPLFCSVAKANLPAAWRSRVGLLPVHLYSDEWEPSLLGEGMQLWCPAFSFSFLVFPHFALVVSYYLVIKEIALFPILSNHFTYLFIFINLFIRLFLAVLGLSCCTQAFSSCGERGGYSSLRCAGFSLRWLLLLRSTGSRHVGFSSCGTWAQ